MSRKKLEEWLKTMPTDDIKLMGIEVVKREGSKKVEGDILPKLEDAGYRLTIHIICKEWEGL
jgi:hypothetical protein